jgi:hypothetical protein
MTNVIAFITPKRVFSDTRRVVPNPRYLTNTPELMTAAGERLEARWKGVTP